MKSFETGFIEQHPIPHQLIRTLGEIHEAKGRAGLYKQQQPQALETLRQTAVIQSTESSNRIEGITAPIARIRALVAENTSPQNRSEQEIVGYRDVLNLIHANHDDISLTPNVILQFHRDMFRYLPGQGGSWKMVDNTISERNIDGTERIRFYPVPAYQTNDAMRQLHAGFERLWHSNDIDHLLLIPAYILDFLCVHPFRDGNGRIARLIALLLLYQSGYDVGRYISLERLTERTKETYYESLYLSSQDWHEGRHSLLPWTQYFLGLVLAAYQDMEVLGGSMLMARGAKSDMVLQAIHSFVGEFSIGELKEACPHVSVDLIRKILQEEKTNGRIEALGRGPQAKWRRISTEF